jgi:prepilin-type N-terminal cleavage/methylation domain-containing protein
MHNPKRFSDKGFSLVELLIVLLIIGIIAQMAIPHLMQSKLAANEASAITTVRSVLNAETLYVTTAGAGRYGDMTALVSGMLVDSVVGSSTKGRGIIDQGWLRLFHFSGCWEYLLLSRCSPHGLQYFRHSKLLRG